MAALPRTRAARVVAWPHWLDSGYIPDLLAALRNEGFDATVSRSLALGTVRLRSGDWLHLHWPGETHISSNRWKYRLRSAAIRAQLHTLKRRGIRIAWTAHNLVPHDDPNPDLGRRARSDLLAVVDHVFVHFAGARDELAETFGYVGPSTIVPHPHYLDLYPPPAPRNEARSKLDLPEDGFVALAFGQIRPYKRVGEIIQAFQQIAGERDRLVIAGKPVGDVDAELAHAGDDPRIVLHARNIPDAEVPLYFGAADVAVIAHRKFFTSASAILSLSMGCPLVGRPIHHLADLAGGQRMFPIEDGHDGLTNSLRDAREVSPTIDRAAVREWAATQGTWSDAASAIAAVLRARDL